jgi:glucokinase
MSENRTRSLQKSVASPPPDLPLVVGVDIGGTQIRTAVLRGVTLLSRVNLLTGEQPAPDKVIPRIFAAIQQALTEARTSLAQVAGIGIAMPGPLNNRTGVVYEPPTLPGWKNVPLRNIVMQQFNVPVVVENDANAAALGEYMFGAGQGSKHMVYLTISTGIGGGIIIDDRILEGASGSAGELGHISIDWRGERCNCGNYGCLEYLASGTAIARQANEAIRAGQGSELLTFARTILQQRDAVPNQTALPISDVAEQEKAQGTKEPLIVNAPTVALAAEAGIPLARTIITNAAEALGAGLVNIIHIFNPELIVLGGGVTQMGALLMEPALHVVQERTMRVPRQDVRIVLAQLSADVGLIGAGALIYVTVQI